MQELIEKSAIQELKARYFRGLDSKDWALFASTMSDDVVGRYSDGQLSFDSREPLVQFMRDNLSTATMLTLHQGHHPEISIDGNNATGIWYLHDIVIDLTRKTRLYGAAVYHDEYRKENGAWLISRTGYSRTFECIEPLHDEHMVLQSMFNQPSK